MRPVIRVWDALIRSLHWLLVAAMVTAWTSGHWLKPWFDEVHHSAGYLAAGVVGLRIVWGFVGSRHARFDQFVRSPRATLAYARQLPSGCEPRHVGHNPLGGWMVLALLATVASLSLTGWLYTTDWLWGYEWLSTLHAALAWLALGLVIAHLGGVVFTSIRHRENLVAAMLSGRKRVAAQGDVDGRRGPGR
jgi:cytochrome b